MTTPPHTTERPRRRWAQRLAGVSIGLLVTLGFLELATRAFGTVHASLTQRDPQVGFTFLPQLDREVYSSEADRIVHVRTNSLGFRGPEFTPEPAEGTARIALVGDSMVAGMQVEESATVACRLGTLLRGPGSHPVEVLNFGLNGSSTGQALALYEKVISKTAPDLVIYAFFVGNDFADNSRRLTSAPRVYFELDAEGELQQIPRSAQMTGASNWLNRYSRFYVWQKSAFRLGQRHLRASAPGDLIFDTSPTERLVDAWALNEALAVTLHGRARDDGAEFLFVLLPSAHSVDAQLFEGLAEGLGAVESPPDIDQPSRRIGAIATEHGIPLLDLTPAFRAAAAEPGAGPADLFLGGIGHFTERGHALVAEHLAQALSAANVLR